MYDKLFENTIPIKIIHYKNSKIKRLYDKGK